MGHHGLEALITDHEHGFPVAKPVLMTDPSFSLPAYTPYSLRITASSCLRTFQVCSVRPALQIQGSSAEEFRRLQYTSCFH
jgi:hypothetical protein